MVSDASNYFSQAETSEGEFSADVGDDDLGAPLSTIFTATDVTGVETLRQIVRGTRLVVWQSKMSIRTSVRLPNWL